jgi:hypothetical protein
LLFSKKGKEEKEQIKRGQKYKKLLSLHSTTHNTKTVVVVVVTRTNILTRRRTAIFGTIAVEKFVKEEKLALLN